jgi:hypothetical protein
MKLGIIGFARSGKTTIFNALTGAHAAVGVFGVREANVAVLKVPDARVDRLAQAYHPKKVTYAEFQFIDVAPNETGGEEKAFDNAALTALKNVESLVHVVRAFKNEDVMHPMGAVDPVRDTLAMEVELQLSDLIVIERRIERLEKEHHKDSDYRTLRRCHEHLEAGKSLRSLGLSPLEKRDISGYGLLSAKPLMLLGNYGEEAIGQADPAGLQECARTQNVALIELCGALELEISGLPAEDRAVYRQELGLGGESRTRFLHTAYDMLGLMSFLTVGDVEVRAWTVPKDTKALEAAAAIHTDIARGFIRAEVVNFDHFSAAGSMAKAKEEGHMRLEGKDYIVRDGDIIHFRFNV